MPIIANIGEHTPSEANTAQKDITTDQMQAKREITTAKADIKSDNQTGEPCAISVISHALILFTCLLIYCISLGNKFIK